MNITLSIAIVTRNRPISLERTLNSLSRQALQPSEIVISDDSDDENYLATNKKLAEFYKCKHIIGPKKGLYANRNFVAKHCSGTHIRTMDDDHEFPDDHIQICINAIENDANSIWTIGEYQINDENRSLPAPIPGQLHPRGFSFVPSNMQYYYGISCGASIYPKSVIDKNILNLETFKFGILYLEYGARLSYLGYTIKHLSCTYVIHHEHAADQSVATMKSKSSREEIARAKVFSMLMFSFHHQNKLSNQLATCFQILKDIINRKYSFKLVNDSIKAFRGERKIQSRAILKMLL